MWRLQRSMSDTELQSNEPQPQTESPSEPEPIVDAPSEPGSTMDAELDALLRHAEALTEVIASNAEGSPEDFLEAIVDQGPVTAKPRPAPPPEAPRTAAPVSDSENAATTPPPVPPEAETVPTDEEAAAESETAEASAAENAATEEDDIISQVESAMASETDVESREPVELSDDQAAEIDTILQEAGAAGDLDESAEAPPRDLPDLLNDPDEAEVAAPAETAPSADAASSDEASPAEPTMEVLYIPDDEEPAAAEMPGDAGTGVPAADKPETVVEEALAEQAVEETAEVAVAETPAEQVAEKAEVPARASLMARGATLLKRVLAVGKRGVRVLARLPTAAVAALGYLLAIINMPFAGLSNRVRDIIGIIAIATLICGVLAWVLPWLFTSNPFVNIPAGIATQH